MAAPIAFRDGFFTFPKAIPISEVVGIDFTISFKRASTLILICKNSVSKSVLYMLLVAHCVAAAVATPVVIYLADYIFLTELLVGLALAYFLLPRYFAAWSNLSKEGVVVLDYEDPADLVNVQKAVFADPRGKKLIKRGLIESKFVEEVCYCFLPNSWFNSDSFRDWVKFLGEVIYPIVVIVCPLVLTVLYMVGPVISQVHSWVKKDYFIRLVVRTAECISDEAEEHMGRYWITRFIFKYYETIYGWYYYVLVLLMGWLQTEVALVVMKIDYMQDRYLRVYKTMKHVYYTTKGIVVGFLRVVFYPAVQLYQKVFQRYNKVVEATRPDVIIKAYEKTKKLNEEVNKVASNAKQYAPDLHPKAE